MLYTGEAIVFPEPGAVEIRTYAVPPCGPEELLVRTRYSLVSTGTELRVWGGHYGAAGKFPLIPGYSIIGEVVEVGDQVTGFAVGDLVSGRNPLPVPGITPYWGAQASLHRYQTTGYDAVLKLPPGADTFDALIAEIGAISWRGVKHAGMAAGETALVVGQGLIGALSAKFLLMHGVKTVVTDVHPLRVQRARAMGVAAAIDMRDPDAVAQVTAAVEGGADILVEASGQPVPAQQALQFLRARGTGDPGPLPRVVLQANYLEPVPVNLARLAPTQALAIFTPGDREPDDRQDVLQFVAAGKISSREFVGETRAFRDAAAAYQALRDAPDEHFSVAFTWEDAR